MAIRFAQLLPLQVFELPLDVGSFHPDECIWRNANMSRCWRG
ncbi:MULTISPECIES: hypothetical protein [Pseudomonas]|nr:hypothetical protein [Pseudomonas sp. BF-RE-26]